MPTRKYRRKRCGDKAKTLMTARLTQRGAETSIALGTKENDGPEGPPFNQKTE